MLRKEEVLELISADHIISILFYLIVFPTNTSELHLIIQELMKPVGNSSYSIEVYCYLLYQKLFVNQGIPCRHTYMNHNLA